jgi:hypothetical protein
MDFLVRTGRALMGGKFRAYSAAKAGGHAFRPFILCHAQAKPPSPSAPARPDFPDYFLALYQNCDILCRE